MLEIMVTAGRMKDGWVFELKLESVNMGPLVDGVLVGVGPMLNRSCFESKTVQAGPENCINNFLFI